MTEIITRTRSISAFSLSLLYLGNLFLKSELINDLCFVLMVAVMLLSLPAITGISRVIGFASLGLSAVLFIFLHLLSQVHLKEFFLALSIFPVVRVLWIMTFILKTRKFTRERS